MTVKNITHEEVKAELLKDPEFRKTYEELEPVYQRKRQRIIRRLKKKNPDKGYVNEKA